MDVATIKKDLENQLEDINKELENIYLPHDAVLIFLGKRTAFETALKLLDSLQKEQPVQWDNENAADKKAVKEIVKTVHKEVTRLVKEMVGKQPMDIPSAGSGAWGTTPPKFKLEVKEQPVEGLEGEFRKEVIKFSQDHFEELHGDMDTIDIVHIIARHFAEWGRKQVLQEIYEGKVKPVDKITAAWLDDESKTEEE